MCTKLTYILFFIIGSIIHAQINIGNGALQHTSTALEISEATNKGLLIPRISLDINDINSTIKPINNPTDGLLIYNYDANKGCLVGFYIWTNKSWQLLSSNENKNTDLLLKNSNTTPSILSLSNIYQDFNSTINNIVTNTIANATISNNHYTLPAGTYSLDLSLTIQGNVPLNTGIAGKDIHNTTYNFRITDTAGNAISEENVVSVASSALNNSKHTILAKLNFSLPQTKTVKIQLLQDTNNSTNTSSTLYYNEGSIHIRKGILK